MNALIFAVIGFGIGLVIGLMLHQARNDGYLYAGFKDDGTGWLGMKLKDPEGVYSRRSITLEVKQIRDQNSPSNRDKEDKSHGNKRR